MPLIRHASASSIARDAVVLDLGDLQTQGRAIIEQARAEAEQVLAAARAERARILDGAAEQGRQTGFSQGLAEGRAMGQTDGLAAALEEHRARFAALELAWTAALTAFERDRDTLLDAFTRDALRLGIQIGQRITRRAVSVDPAVVAEQMRSIMELIARPTALILRVHPSDRQAAQHALPALLATFTQVRHAHITDDPSLEPGSCIARTAGSAPPDAGHPDAPAGGGVIDSSIPTQLERIAEALLPGVPSDLAAQRATDPSPASPVLARVTADRDAA